MGKLVNIFARSSETNKTTKSHAFADKLSCYFSSKQRILHFGYQYCSHGLPCRKTSLWFHFKLLQPYKTKDKSRHAVLDTLFYRDLIRAFTTFAGKQVNIDIKNCRESEKSVVAASENNRCKLVRSVEWVNSAMKAALADVMSEREALLYWSCSQKLGCWPRLLNIVNTFWLLLRPWPNYDTKRPRGLIQRAKNFQNLI